MKKKLKARVLSALISASMVLNCIPAYAAPLFDGTVNQQETQDESQLDTEVYDVFTPHNATLNAEMEIEGDVAAYKVINERFTVDGIMYKEIGPGEAQAYAIAELGDGGAVYIPNHVVKDEGLEKEEEYTTITISDELFKENNKIVTVEIEEGVAIEELADEMFADCERLKSITYPTTVTSIGDRAFQGCKRLTEIKLSNQVTSIGNEVFKDCKRLEKVDLNQVTVLPEYAFSGCSSLENIDIGNIEVIANYAFEECDSLTEISLTDKTTSVGEGSFINCNKLEMVELASTISALPSHIFSGCESLERINLAEVDYIGDYAFYNCESLELPALSPELTTIGSYAFANCYNIYERFWDHVDNCQNDNRCKVIVDEYEYYGTVCSEALKYAILIPDSVNNIGEGAFYLDYGDNTRSLTCASSSMNIWDALFESCVGYPSIVYIEDDGLYIEGWYYDDYMEPGEYIYTVDDESETRYTYRILEYPMCDENGWEINGKVEVVEIDYPNYEALSEYQSVRTVIIPNVVFERDGGVYFDVMSINGNLRNGFSDSEYCLILGENVTYIGDTAFKDDQGLISIDFASSKLEIGDHAFENCTNLERISYNYIGEQALSEVDAYLEIPEQIHTIGDRAFAGCDAFAEVYIPYSVENWGEEVFADCEGLQEVQFDSVEYLEWLYDVEIDSDKKILRVPDGIFRGCISLKEVFIPDTITQIGEGAFEDCSSFCTLGQYTYKEDVNQIVREIVDGLIPQCTLPTSIESIGSRAFYGCSKWESVHAGSNIKSVGVNAFSKGTKFTSDSSRVQLLLVESLDNDTYAETSWNGVEDIEPGAIVTLDGDIIAGGENGITIGRNAQVYFGEVDTVTITGNVTLARDAVIHIPDGKKLVIASGAKINGVASDSENSNGVEDGALYIEGTIKNSGSIGTNVAIYKKLTKDMVEIDTTQKYILGSENQDPIPTVAFALDGFTQTYTSGEDKDYSCTYSGNDRAGTAYVVLKANKNGRLLGGEVKIPYQIKKADPSVSVVSKVEGTNVTITATVDKKTAASGGRDRVEIKATRQVSGSEKQNVLLKTLWLNEDAGTESSKTKTVSYTWENVYNGTYNIEVAYSGDANHNSAMNTDGTFTVTSYESNKPSGGGSSDGGNGGGSIGGVGGSTIMPPIDHTDDEKPDYGILTLDPIKGLIGSKYGIITSNYDSHRSHWELDEISALIWGGSADNYWKLQYRDGSYAAGSKATDENGKAYESYHWEFINKKWWAFDSDGFAKIGWLYDENYDGWFYIHVKHGMQTGWICVGDKWYYMNPDTAGCEGKMYAAQWTPDGYYVDESGAWDGRPQMLNAQ